jgi:predicted nucleic acid-binding protein
MAADSRTPDGPQFVLDCSAALAWCFPDEADAAGEKLLRALDRGTAVVPGLWFLEVANALAAAERRGRVSRAEADEALRLLSRLPIRADDRSGFTLAADLLALARSRRLSAYDAAYLELAARARLPLATLDRKLRAAATAAGVGLYPP